MKKEIRSLEEFILQVKRKKYSKITITPFGNLIPSNSYEVQYPHLLYIAHQTNPLTIDRQRDEFAIRFMARGWFFKIVYYEYLYSFIASGLDFNKQENEIRPLYGIKAVLIAEQRLTTLQKTFPTLYIPITRIDNGDVIDVDAVHKDAKERNITIDTDLEAIK